MFLPNWPHDVFGHITAARIASRTKPDELISVPVANIESIRIFYNKDKSDALCE